ncbi:UPF0213 protein YazA [Companilactobacillus sp. RD055328]|uniref:GIY-YIG nuclease family protein n=1 Tax=Companilactobacillus sp. RD055328 TaxID=2916634 RepID=UPI001FC8E421|nr:GIY-YIG nuclease family protein [Companilactobacillus sp. RD055328]GKQ42601.1 UPF0213 protein YazA [Companilactobacillus sp. RD055328]
MEENNYYVYLLQCSDNTFYIGTTNDVEKRVATHNAGKGAKYTKIRRPVKLLYFEDLHTKSQALKREHELKKLSRIKKEELLIKNHIKWHK